MLKAAIVEDDDKAAAELKRYLRRYADETGAKIDADVYGDALSFLAAYSGYDIVFMDIELPDYDGMRAAKKLRETDKTVVIVFVTNMRRYAVEGYEVGALDFMMKPVGWQSFRTLMGKAEKVVYSNRDAKVTIKTWGGGIKLLDAKEIYFVEVTRHHLVFHTVSGDYDMYGDLVSMEKVLPERSFARCNSCYLVNLRYVRAVEGDTVNVSGYELKISRPKKKEFLQRIAEYIGGGMDIV